MSFSTFSRLLRIPSTRLCLNSRANFTVLAIESSCDDSCVAIVDSSKKVLAERRISFIESQRTLRGISPLVSAQQHRSNIDRLVEECIHDAGIRLSDLDAIACTVEPGLVLCLKVGTDKALAVCRDNRLDFIPIHHMKAHAIVSRLIFDDVEFPFLCLLISGGHGILCLAKSAEDFEILGQTNIGPGEAIDKVAREAGIVPLTHYGSAVEEYAKKFNGTFSEHYATRMPYAEGADFDFLTIKHIFTSKFNNPKNSIDLNVFCADLQFAITAHLCQKLDFAIQYSETNGTFQSNRTRNLVISGGVAANSFIRNAVEKVAKHYEFQTRIPPKSLVVDNAVMCAWTAIEMLSAGTDKLIAHDKLPNFWYSTAKSPIGQDLRESVSKFKPQFKLKLSSMYPNVEKLLYKKNL